VIVLKLDNLNCQDICNKIQRFLNHAKPDISKQILVIRLQNIIDSGDNHIPKLEHKIIQE
jgi:hypothetical protein